MLSLNGLLMNTFMGSEFVDKQSGAITPATLKIQILCDIPQKSGDVKKDLLTLSVKDSKFYDIYKSLTGKNISVGVGAMAQGKTVSFWILPNTRPVQVSGVGS